MQLRFLAAAWLSVAANSNVAGDEPTGPGTEFHVVGYLPEYSAQVSTQPPPAVSPT